MAFTTIRERIMRKCCGSTLAVSHGKQQQHGLQIIHSQSNRNPVDCFNSNNMNRIGPTIIIIMVLTQINFLLLLLESAEHYSHLNFIVPQQQRIHAQVTKRQQLLNGSTTIVEHDDPWWALSGDLERQKQGQSVWQQNHIDEEATKDHVIVYNDTILIISCHVITHRYLGALWSSLECMAPMYEHVHLALPEWSRSMMEEFVHRVWAELPHLHLTRHYVMLTRWDMGLWCDVLEILDYEHALPRYIVLLSGNVFTIRPSTKLLDKLRTNRYDMVGMTYYQHQEEYYVEQFMRGFTSDSIQTFRNFSCLPIYDQSYGFQRVNLVVRNMHVQKEHEMKLHTIFSRDRVTAIYQANPSERYAAMDQMAQEKTWEATENGQYWELLRDTEDFPFAKADRPWQVSFDLNNLHLQACMQKVNSSWLLGLFNLFPYQIELK